VESPKDFAVLARMSNEKSDAGLIARHYLAEKRVDAVATGCPAAALVSDVARQDSGIRSEFMAGSDATRRALADTKGLASDTADISWAALAMLVGGLSLMRVTDDAAARAKIRDQISDALQKLAKAEPAA
jgi:TetR/AcrR family transcriptional regulator, transcriptional repressor for nem operon